MTTLMNARGFASGLGEISEDDAAALVARIQDGDSEALGQLYRHGRERVERYLGRRMVEPADVEDVVQETFLRVPEMTKDFNPDTTEVGAWLCGRVARWTLTDYGRKDRFRHLSAKDSARAAVVEAAHLGPVESAHERESRPLSPRMVHALAKLTSAQRQGMQLRYLDEMTPAQAAKVAGSSAGAIAQNCLAARKKLRAQLADLAPVSSSVLDGMSKKDAVLTALRTVGSDDVSGAVEWLREQGVTVDRSYIYAIRNGRRGPAPTETGTGTDTGRMDTDDTAAVAEPARAEPVVDVPAPRSGKPERQAGPSLAASQRRTDEALRAATAAVQQMTQEHTGSREADAEQERAQQLARWHADDQADESARDERLSLGLAS